jgi:hypothetical protein
MAVQSNFNFTGANPIAAAYTNPNAGGNTSVAMIWLSGTAVITGHTISDTNGNVYVQETTAFNGGLNELLLVYVATGIAAGANTVTFTAGSGSNPVLFIAEEGASSGVRVANGASGSTGIPTVSLAGTVANDTCVALATATGGTTQSAGNFGTNAANQLQNFAAATTFFEDGNSSGGTINATVGGAAANWAIVAIALMPGGANAPFFGCNF